jgi:hypothetical protein
MTNNSEASGMGKSGAVGAGWVREGLRPSLILELEE